MVRDSSLEIENPDISETSVIDPSASELGRNRNGGGYYNSYPWLIKTNDKNFRITMYKIHSDDSKAVVMDTGDPAVTSKQIEPIDSERTLWKVVKIIYYDYTCKSYELYYESDTCEKYLVVDFPKSTAWEKPFYGEILSYGGETYNVVIDHYHDYISGIQYPNGTQYYVKDNRAVGLVGEDDIYGDKTFNNIIYSKIAADEVRSAAIRIQNMHYALGTAPANDDVTQIQIRDSANDYTSMFEYMYNSDGSVMTDIYCRKPDKSSSAILGVGYGANGTAYTKAPACDWVDSIVTTVNSSKSSNGYFQLGNGLIIQWGFVEATTATSGTVTYPKAFTNAASRVILNANTSGVIAYPTTETTTDFKWNKTNTSCSIKWIAVGY